MSNSYVVVGPLVTAHTGGMVIGFGAGATLPSDVPDRDIQHLLANNLIADRDKLEELQAARPGEPTGPHGRSGLAVDQLTEDEDGLFGNDYVVSGATTADPEYAARAKANPQAAATPRPDPATILDPQERLDAQRAVVDQHNEFREAEAKARQTRDERAAAAAEGRPAQNEPKAAWVEHAVAQGTPGRVERAEAEAMSKEQLVGRFGSKR